MTPYQDSYSETYVEGAQGMIANSEPYNHISRTNTEVIGFGQPAYEGAANHEIVAGAAFAATSAGAAVAGNTGAATITAAPAVVSPAVQGVYLLTAISAGATAEWLMTRPDGTIVGNVTTAVAATIDGIGPFTITDAGADPAIGDQFTITVTYTENAKFIGLTIRDPVVPAVATNPDQYPVDYTASVMDFGVMWVTCSGAVVRGTPVYWNPATGLYTAATGIRIPNAEFYESKTGTLVRVKLRRTPV